VEKYRKTRQATDDNIMLLSKYGLCMQHNYGKNPDVLATYNTKCFFTENKLIESALMSRYVYSIWPVLFGIFLWSVSN